MANGTPSTAPATPVLSTTSPPLPLHPPTPPPRRQPSSSFHLLAGLASGLTTSILLQPADLLKTRVQQSPSSSIRPILASILAHPNPLRTLWRGTLPSALRTGIGSALYLTTLHRLRTALAPPTAPSSRTSPLPSLPASLNLAAGAAARATVGFIMMPITVLKVRYESSLYRYRSLAAAGAAILAERGPRGFFAGAAATALRDAPYAGLYVVAYEWAKGALGARAPAGDPAAAAAVHFVAAGGAAAAATAATNPPDAVKTRLQLRPGEYRNTWQAARRMLREEGVRSMFDGLGLRMARKAASAALGWTVYEECVRRAQARLYDA